MSRPRVALFVTCLVDFFRPGIGFSTLRLLEDAGCEVVVPEAQTCCGQPAWNAGDRDGARRLALAFLDAFAAPEVGAFDHLVAPSGSCVGMLRQFPEVLGAADPRHGEAEALASRAHELSSFLVDVLGHDPGSVAAPVTGTAVTYHDSCAGLRECGIKGQPRNLLAGAGVDVVEMDRAETCCGFGGTFCIKYPEISGGMVDDKLASIERSGADVVVAGDLGCLLNIEGRLSRAGRPVRALHFAEVLTGALADPSAADAERVRDARGRGA